MKNQKKNARATQWKDTFDGMVSAYRRMRNPERKRLLMWAIMGALVEFMDEQRKTK